jgi:hypothetical protein
VCEVKVKDKTDPVILQHVMKESKGVNFTLDSLGNIQMCVVSFTRTKKDPRVSIR